METPEVCPERIALAHVWMQAVSDEIHAVRALCDATNQVSRFDYNALYEEAKILQERAKDAHAEYDKHRIEHGCDPVFVQLTQSGEYYLPKPCNLDDLVGWGRTQVKCSQVLVELSNELLQSPNDR